MKIFLIILIILICIFSAWMIYSFFARKRRPSIDKKCSVCGVDSKYGYSVRTESIRPIKWMCRRCLISQLEKDYASFSGRAVVIQPVAGPPCYVFHPNNEWAKSFKQSRMDDDARAYLLRIEPICRDCGKKANFLWIESSGLTAHNFGNVLAKGFAETLLPRNPKPVSLCGKCCVGHISRELEAKDITYHEVCGPKGVEDGFVMPMAY